MLYIKIKNTSQPAAPSNTAPTTFTLNWASSFPGGSAAESAAVGTTLATLSASPGTNHSFILTNDPDNKFKIVNNTLVLNVALNYATKTSHQFAIKALNSAGETGVQNFTLNVVQTVITQTYPVGVGPSGPKFFVIGQFIPTPTSAAAVKARGINTAYYKGDTTEFSLETWISAMATAGLRTIRQPRGAHTIGYYASAPSTQEPDTGRDLEKSDTNLLAFVYPDEPDNVPGGVLDATTVGLNPATLQSFRNSTVAAMGLPAGKNIPWMVNLVANHIWNYGETVPVMQDYIQGGEAEWITADVYPRVSGFPTPFIDRDGYHMTYQGRTVKIQRQLAPAKAHMGVLQSSDFASSGAMPTRDELRMALWDMVIQGASGISYFSPRFNPWSWDATDPNLELEMKAQHAILAQYEAQLIDTTNGGARAATVYDSALSGNTPTGSQLPYPFTARTIPQPDGSTLYVVLNLSTTSQTLTYSPWQTTSMPFGPGEVKIVYTMAYTPAVTPPPGTGTTVASARWPVATRLMPGKNTIPGDHLQGDYIVGRTSTNSFKVPTFGQTAVAGLNFDFTIKFLTIGTAFNGQTLEDWNLDGWLLGFANNVQNVTIKQNKFTNSQVTSISIVNMDVATGLSGIIYENNDFLGANVPRGSSSTLGQLSWINFGTAYTTIVRKNFFYYASNDVFKCDGGTIEENFIYGGGTSQGTHYDVLQTGSLGGAITFRYNHVLAEGDNTGDGTYGGGTNILRLVPNNGASTAGKSNPIRAYENVMAGMGWQVTDDTWDNVEIYNNWQGLFQYGPESITATAAAAFVKYYGNKNLITGAAFPQLNPPSTPVAPNISVSITGTAQVGQTLTANVTVNAGNPTPTHAYQWKVAGVNVGTNSQTYVPVTGDATKTATVTVTSTNASGTGNTPITSAATGAIAAAGGGGGSITTAFDTTNIVGYSLSNSNRTASVVNGVAYYNNAQVAGTASGKKAVAFTWVSGSFNNGCGISPWPVQGWDGWQNPGIQSDGNVYGTSPSPTFGALSVGDVIYIAYDYTANKIWFRKNSGYWNNDASADPATGTGGLTPNDSMTSALPFVQTESSSAGVATINTSWTLPSGFSGW